MLKNNRQELFAQLVAKGWKARDAYLEAGYSDYKVPKKSSELRQKPEIGRRIEELLERGATRVELSRAQILEQLRGDHALARELGQVNAAIRATELLGRELHKMFTERKEIGPAGAFDDKGIEELKRYIAKEIADLKTDGVEIELTAEEIKDFETLPPPSPEN
jgi:hypothetical protein